MSASDSKVLGCLAGLALAACSSASHELPNDAGLRADASSALLSRADLLKPETCKTCHPTHYREWASSMHAYAADDPVFLAMNQRGQRETDGGMGDFCVKCHAPMATHENATKDGLNLASLPPELKGVTCYFCHSVDKVLDDHNASVELASDGVMRGPLHDAVSPGVHGVSYSELHDRSNLASTTLCGGCHDVVNTQNAHIERTSLEYHQSAYARPGVAFQSCQTCHMDGTAGKAAVVPGLDLPNRTIHEHLWPAVDTALTSFPDQDVQKAAVACALAGSVRVFSLSADALGAFTVVLETEAGHNQPSGAAQDRRLWLEFIAYDDQNNIVYQSAAIADDQPEASDAGVNDPKVDPNPTIFRDRMYDQSGREVNMFWLAAPSTQNDAGFSSVQIPVAVDFSVPHSIQRVYRVPTGLPARATLRVRLRPVGRDVLDDLVASGDLQQSVVTQMPTYTISGTEFEWTKADGLRDVSAPQPSTLHCPNDYRCLLDPSGAGCSP